MEKDETITISRKEYEKLCASDEFLSCLDACGVDNWDGYEDAQKMFNIDRSINVMGK